MLDWRFDGRLHRSQPRRWIAAAGATLPIELIFLSMPLWRNRHSGTGHAPRRYAIRTILTIDICVCNAIPTVRFAGCASGQCMLPFLSTRKGDMDAEVGAIPFNDSRAAHRRPPIRTPLHRNRFQARARIRRSLQEQRSPAGSKPGAPRSACKVVSCARLPFDIACKAISQTHGCTGMFSTIQPRMTPLEPYPSFSAIPCRLPAWRHPPQRESSRRVRAPRGRAASSPDHAALRHRH